MGRVTKVTKTGLKPQNDAEGEGTSGAEFQDVAGLVVSYKNRPDVLQAVLSLKQSGIREIVVWDNSEDFELRNDPALCGSSLARVLVLGGRGNLGFGTGVNCALGHISKRYVLVLNPDAAVTREAVNSIHSLVKDEGVMLVAPRMLDVTGEGMTSGGAFPRLSKEVMGLLRIDEHIPRQLRALFARLLFPSRHGGGSVMQSREHGEPIELDWVSGFCFIIDVRTAVSLGPFDENFFLYFEDVDLCRRIWDRGGRVVLDRRTGVLHRESHSMGSRKTRYYWQGFSTYAEKHLGWFSRKVAKSIERAVS